MKFGALSLLLLTLASCSDTVLDPNDLNNGNGDPTAGDRNDMVFYNREVVNIGIGSYRSVHRVSLSTGALDTLTLNGFISAPPVGSKMVFIDDQNLVQNVIYICNLDGSNAQSLIADGYIGSATLSPDGNYVLYTETYENPAFITFSRIKYFALLTPSIVSTIATDADPSIMPTFSPDGKYVAYSQLDPNATDMLAIYDLTRGSTTLVDVGLSSFSIDLEFDWTADSKNILCVNNQDVALVALSGNITPLGFSAGATVIPIFPVLSPDGQVALTGYDLTTNLSDIYVYNGSSWKNITNSSNVTEYLPHFSADGKKLVYSSVAGTLNPFTQLSTIPSSDLMIYENNSVRTLDNGMIVRPLFGR